MKCFELSGREKPSGSKVLLLFSSLLVPSDPEYPHFGKDDNIRFGHLFQLNSIIGFYLSPTRYFNL